ncbi:hypothetical protein [Mycobacterium sp. NPDC050853]|uniref:hypothetical protein n=1 Tax=Mycobacterium sp. NPDC050853 TaxID=3155160 RepID=UPI0033E523C4
MIAALPILHCTVAAETALPVMSHHSIGAASGALEDASHHIGRTAEDFSSQIFDVIAGKIRSGNSFRLLWATALVMTMILVLHPLRVRAIRAPPPRRLVYMAMAGGRGRLQQICVSRR